MRHLLLAGLVVLILALVVVGCMVSGQSRMIYLPRPYLPGELADFEAGGGLALAYRTAEGRQVAHYLPPARGEAAGRADQPAEVVWLVFSGNGGRALDYWPGVAGLWPKEVGILFIDYPSYGLCEGRPDPDSIRASSLAAVDALAAHWGLDREALVPRLRALGHSLGSVVALNIAADLRLPRAVAVAPFTSMEDMAARMVGRPLTAFLRHRFDARGPLGELARSGAHVTIVHGTADRVIPVRMGRDLASAHPDQVRLVLVDGGGHNDLFHRAAHEIGLALREAVPPRQPAQPSSPSPGSR